MKNDRYRVYISGAISDNPNYMRDFSEAEQLLRKNGYTDIINPAMVNVNMPESTTYEEYMKMCITMMDMCDAIYLIDGWTTSRGSMFEHKYMVDIQGKSIVEIELPWSK